MPSNKRINPNQGELISITPSGRLIPGNFSAPEATVINNPEPGPSIYLVERAQDLHTALELLGKASQRRGLRTAVDTYHREEIEKRYKHATDEVASRAQENAEDLEGQARTLLMRNVGAAALRHAGLIDETGAKKMENDEWKQFLIRYADAKGRPARDTKKKQLKSALRTL